MWVHLSNTGLYSLASILIPALAPGGNRRHVFLLGILCSIAERKEELAIVGTKATDNEHDLEGLADGVAREGKKLKQFLEVSSIRIRGRIAFGKNLGFGR